MPGERGSGKWENKVSIVKIGNWVNQFLINPKLHIQLSKLIKVALDYICYLPSSIPDGDFSINLQQKDVYSVEIRSCR